MTAEAVRSFRDRWLKHKRNDVTEIIPVDGFDDFEDLYDLGFAEIDELQFSDDYNFYNETQVLRTSEIDDLQDIGSLVSEPLAAPDNLTPNCTSAPCQPGQHRKQPTSAARGRLLISAMAAGAVAAAAHTVTSHADIPKTETVLTANASELSGGAVSNATHGVQVITVHPAASAAVHNEEHAKGTAFAHERAQREARLSQPLYVMPTKGICTSNFGYRWGVLHAGIDLANAIGTPILAVSDGVVIDAGPTAGYGMWVKLRHADGTVTLYGHVDTTLVNVGQHVMAGDQIATMGNRGNSTGPHLHFEVLLGGSERIDPVPWLAKRGIYVGNYTG
ncbi:M23 family metallopeptidase [Mycobacterium lepromatosis]|uniref:M23ase beta-sheet core domain-containing protein n=1 Tax=Mycobacterium lepromatosis TaxID=480418 RepID=A0A0F4ESN8_9MYCO|nr:M23 family metallopeptidase [Mycobacterium lepromatosis]KJX75818.1 hypothetical protein MLPM_0154 [Mycobacterium lepromatosis]